ncbi:MAG: DNA replication complex GINS family protein [archaeon]|nr:DNA replication complex GINS family protein [archaeon]
MISYNDMYELLRKEKFSENLQLLPKDFLKDVSDYLSEKKEQSSKEDDLFADSINKTKKQLENSIAIFKEMILRRKKKLLNLVFVAAETGIMKRDYENMLPMERDLFEKLVKAFEESDKDLGKTMSAKKAEEGKKNKMIIFNQDVEQFVDMTGNLIGPFAAGELANIENEISAILVSGGKATFVDEQ